MKKFFSFLCLISVIVLATVSFFTIQVRAEIKDGTWYPSLRMCDCVEVSVKDCPCKIVVTP